MKTIIFVISFLLISSSAYAEDIHDGFQFRYTVGAGYLSDYETTPGAKDDSIGGPSYNFALFLGGSVIPGLFIGGMSDLAWAHNPNVYFNGQTFNTSGFDLQVLSIAPYVDLYPNPNKGLHLMFNMGVGIFNIESRAITDNAIGIALGGGIGYDWHVGRHGNIGILGKLNYADVDLSYKNMISNEKVIMPSVMFSISSN